MHNTNPLLAQFLDDRESLSDLELGDLAELLLRQPALAVELKQQLVVDELLGQRLAVDRQNFTAQVRQRIVDLKRGDEEMHRQIQELRTLATNELGQTASYSRSALLLSALATLAVALLVAVGLRFWQPESLAVIDDSYGAAQRIRAGRAQPVANAEEVFVGDQYETSSQQALTVRYPDNTLVQVDGASLVEFGNDDETAGKRIFIHRGSLSATVSPQASGRPLVIRTEGAEAKVLGTQFWLSRQGATTRLDVLEGRVALAALAGGPPQIVSSGQYGAVSAAGVTTGNVLWPTTREGLAFLFETDDRGNLVRELSTGRLRACRLSPRGFAHLNSDFALALRGGSFVARGADDDLVEACRRSGQWSLLISLSPSASPAAAEGVIATFASEPGLVNFRLTQAADQLVFQMRTRHNDQDLLCNPLPLCQTPAGKTSHLGVAYRPGRLVCSLNGQTVLTTEAIQGDLSNWLDGHLVFGSQPTGTQPWFGAQEGIALYSRALSETELAAQAQAYQQSLAGRVVAERVELTATVVALSETPTTDDMAPEEAALCVDKYRVDQVHQGDLAAGEVYVARWSMLAGVAQRAPAPGQQQRLSLETFAANRQLETFVCRDDFASEAPGLPRYFLVAAE